mgnify:FL=1
MGEWVSADDMRGMYVWESERDVRVSSSVSARTALAHDAVALVLLLLAARGLVVFGFGRRRHGLRRWRGDRRRAAGLSLLGAQDLLQQVQEDVFDVG